MNSWEIGGVCIVWGMYISGKLWMYYKCEDKNENKNKGNR